jgi:hypothetical protein
VAIFASHDLLAKAYFATRPEIATPVHCLDSYLYLSVP